MTTNNASPICADRITENMMSHHPIRRLALIVLATLMSGIYVTLAHATEPSRPGPVDEDAYRLGSMDKVRLKIFEWRAAIDVVHEWKALNAEYVVGSNGKLSVPLLGEIKADGLTTAELGQMIGRRMGERIGLVVVPKVSVEVVQHRPFYIIGAVRKPGEYEFRPRLNVLQAVAIAGGGGRFLDRERDVDRELISTQGAIDLHTVERRSLIARRARLEAEIRGLSDIKYSAEFDTTDPDTRGVVERENSLFQLERRGFIDRLDMLGKRRENLHAEVTTLRAHIQNHRAQAKLAQDELEKVERLLADRLTVQPRRLEAQRNVYQMTSVGLRLESDLRTVFQNIAVTESEIERVRWEQRSQAMKDLRATDLRIAELERRLITARKLYREIAQFGATSGGASGTDAIIHYIILRQSNDGMQKIDATEASLVAPGDTLKVEIEASPEFSANTLSAPIGGLQARPQASTGAVFDDTVRKATIRGQPMPAPKPPIGTAPQSTLFPPDDRIAVSRTEPQALPQQQPGIAVRTSN
ncbi:MAG: polysaccharide biosynthesis/export family protein [Hyphomicrobiaceae bacterium]